MGARGTSSGSPARTATRDVGTVTAAEAEAADIGVSPAVAEAMRVQWMADGVLNRPDDVVLWRRLAVAGWVTEAGRRGLYAEDATYDVLEWRRDSDEEYAGAVRVGDEVVDLVVWRGTVHVCGDGRYEL